MGMRERLGCVWGGGESKVNALANVEGKGKYGMRMRERERERGVV